MTEQKKNQEAEAQNSNVEIENLEVSELDGEDLEEVSGGITDLNICCHNA